MNLEMERLKKCGGMVEGRSEAKKAYTRKASRHSLQWRVRRMGEAGGVWGGSGVEVLCPVVCASGAYEILSRSRTRMRASLCARVRCRKCLW